MDKLLNFFYLQQEKRLLIKFNLAVEEDYLFIEAAPFFLFIIILENSTNICSYLIFFLQKLHIVFILI
jgi:hypothetical protein